MKQFGFQILDEGRALKIGSAKFMVGAIQNLKSKIQNKTGRRSGRLVRDYFLISVILIGSGLLSSGLLEIYFQYRESRENLNLLQQEIAAGAAFKTEQFIQQIEAALRTATKSPEIARKGLSDPFQTELTRLLLVTPAMEEVMALDLTGRIHLQASRFRAILPEDKEEVPPETAFDAAKNGKSFFGPVYFARGSEPYNSIAVPIERFAGELIGIMWAKVNLKYIWEVIQDIRIGTAGYAYIVTRSGDLVAHPDLSLVLRRQNVAHLHQVRDAFQVNATTQSRRSLVSDNFQGSKVFASYAYIPSLDWAVIIERPLDEAYASLYASIFRTSSVLLIGLGMALLASVFVARRVVRPLEALRRGVERIGQGDLIHRLEIKTGDEIETLAEEFNKMTAALQEAYTGLEKKVTERTQELTEALEQKSAIAEVLHVMARSPKDIQPVLNAMIANAVRLAGAKRGVIYTFDGEVLRAEAYDNLSRQGLAIVRDPIKPNSDGAVARAFRSRKPVHIPDIQVEPGYSGPSKTTGTRTLLAVPMLLMEEPVGIICIIRDFVEPFTQAEVNLVTTFADQAVIAIESVQLFQQLQSRTGDLARSVDELRALGEVSQAVSSSLDLQTVLTTVVSHAVVLSGSDSGALCEFDDHNNEFRFRATHQVSTELVKAIEEVRIPLEETVLGRTVSTGELVQVPDVMQEPDYPLWDVMNRMGMRALLGVPLVRQGKVIGALVVGRKSPGEFPKEIVDLLQTFASQSVLAIQNARLFRDTKEQRLELEVANQRLQELDKLKSAFLSNVSHELRTPLTAVKSLTINMLDGITGKLNDKQIRYITGIKESTDRLARLINDLLDISIIEAGRVQLNATSFSLGSLIHEVTDTLRSVAEEKDIRLEAAVDGTVTVWADRDKVNQVLTNLISNAVKFTSSGKVDVSFKKDGAAWVQISVADTGSGIAADETNKIFDEFYQITQPGEKKSKGVGLGLAISKKLVEMQGGRMWVESIVGGGSTFSFTLPTSPTPGLSAT
jgi:signal transduction histidine kinase